MSTPKIIIVTGSNSGIGWETVKALLESSKQYTILAGARTNEKATAAIEEWKKVVPNTKSTVEPLVVDLESDDSIENARKEVEAKYGVVDVLLNNAGKKRSGVGIDRLGTQLMLSRSGTSHA
jgi:NAD(P)-dependent dehydrogenase (short-subunit alcohol dehydrogenase family)